ncbi:MAG: ferrous iron transport protein B [Fimbriimonas sp.]|nr:ferrous iron transport protein B [Fimbriimonas sp.]
MKSNLSNKPSAKSELHSDQPLIALVGNPNAGKTTLFNSLTGSYQKVGNYPGVTVEKVSGALRLDAQTVECIDVPGLYSMYAVSEDERVAVEVIEGTLANSRRPDLLVCVLDATNLERNLYFFSQLAEARNPMVVALTMVDRLQQSGQSIDLPKMSNLLAVEVVPMVGHRDKGLQELKDAIERNLASPRFPVFDIGFPDALETCVASLRERVARVGIDFTKSDIRKALLDPEDPFNTFLKDFPEMQDAFREARERLTREGVIKPALEVSSRYQWASMVKRAVVRESTTASRNLSLTDRIDLVLTHRVFGLVVFLTVMYLVFQSIYTFAQPLMNGILASFGWLKDMVGPHLAQWPVVRSLVVDGVLGGVGGMLVFLPQILILFMFIAMLEGTGYLSRAAFLMDRLFGWCGLNGRAFIPLLSSFACAIPGIMAARVMPDRNSRLATILVAPLMSCSARLPVYLLLIGAFIQPRYGPIWAGFALFAMHLLGLVVAIPIVWFLNRKVIRGKRLPFLLELPPYQWPRWRDVWIAMYFRAKIFVKTAGTIIVFMSVLIWGLSYFPRLSTQQRAGVVQHYLGSNPGAPKDDVAKEVDRAQLANSILGRFGKAIEPAFVPAGFDWRITTSILSAFPARETVVPSLGIIFSLGGDVDEKSPDLPKALNEATWPDGRPLFTPWTAVGLMVFFALCAQCMATLATVKRETNSWKWPLFMFTYMTVLAYIAAVAVQQIGRWFGG